MAASLAALAGAGWPGGGRAVVGVVERQGPGCTTGRGTSSSPPWRAATASACAPSSPSTSAAPARTTLHGASRLCPVSHFRFIFVALMLGFKVCGMSIALQNVKLLDTTTLLN